MAITAATITSDFNSAFRSPTLAGYVFERAARGSVVQQLVPQIALGGNGVAIPVVSGRPSVGWVGEGEKKPATSGSISVKTMTPKKVAAILLISKEVVRANPGGYVEMMKGQLADEFAVAFDRAALHDEGPSGQAGGGPFDTFIDQTTKVSEIGAAANSAGALHTDLVNALADVVTDTDATGRRYQFTGWALDSVLEPTLWGALDNNGRPLYVDLPSDQVSSGISSPGRLLNRPSFMGEGVATADAHTVVGYGGDWRTAKWGVVGGIEFSATSEAAVDVDGSLVSTWQNNLVAIKAEAEYGFIVDDVNAFSKLTNTNNSPITSS